MEDVTTIGEVLEFAVARETEAVNFYMAMARMVTDSSTVRFFEDLVSEELEHKSRLELEVMKEGIVSRTVGVLPETLTADLPVSPDQVDKEMVYTEALSLAILKERRSFKLYVRLAGMVGEEELRETLVSLAEEEARHLITLEEQHNNAMPEQ
jgi:rubrerythrin